VDIVVRAATTPGSHAMGATGASLLSSAALTSQGFLKITSSRKVMMKDCRACLRACGLATAVSASKIAQKLRCLSRSAALYIWEMTLVMTLPSIHYPKGPLRVQVFHLKISFKSPHNTRLPVTSFWVFNISFQMLR
jgi:hypothetical protein